MPHVIGEAVVEKDAEIRPHAERWDEALDNALDKARELGFAGQTVNVTFSAEIKPTQNPSQVQKYIVTLS